MKFIDVTVRGTSPLIMDKFPDGQELKPTRRSNSRRSELDTPLDQASLKAYVTIDGKHLMWPGRNLWSCLISAGKFQKIGKRQLTTRDASILPGIFSLIDFEELILVDPTTKQPYNQDEFEVDSRPVVNASTKSTVISHRPRLDKWEISFTLSYDDTELDDNIVRQLIDDGGRRIGIGVMRAERKGLYGQFKVVSWKETTEPSA